MQQKGQGWRPGRPLKLPAPGTLPDGVTREVPSWWRRVALVQKSQKIEGAEVEETTRADLADQLLASDGGGDEAM
eukprot:3087716-Amphidinium_carterae.1